MSCRKDGSAEIPASGGDFCARIVDMRTRWLVAALLLCTVLAALEWWAVENFIFWKYVWFDLPMHFLGGLALGVLAVGIINTRNVRYFILFLLLAFVGWEVFEYVFGVPREANYAFDTSIDIVMDTLGALVAYTVAARTIWKKA